MPNSPYTSKTLTRPLDQCNRKDKTELHTGETREVGSTTFSEHTTVLRGLQNCPVARSYTDQAMVNNKEWIASTSSLHNHSSQPNGGGVNKTKISKSVQTTEILLDIETLNSIIENIVESKKEAAESATIKGVVSGVVLGVVVGIVVGLSSGHMKYILDSIVYYGDRRNRAFYNATLKEKSEETAVIVKHFLDCLVYYSDPINRALYNATLTEQVKALTYIMDGVMIEANKSIERSFLKVTSIGGVAGVLGGGVVGFVVGAVNKILAKLMYYGYNRNR
jgi:hypothetical protein